MDILLDLQIHFVRNTINKKISENALQSKLIFKEVRLLFVTPFVTPFFSKEYQG